MTRAEIKDRAKAQLGRKIFGSIWLTALGVCFIQGAIMGIVGAIVAGIGAIIVTGPLVYGVSYCFLKQARDGQQMNVSDMFKGFTDCFGDSFLIGLLTAIFTALWSLLFVIPGIVKALSYSMAYYVKLDHPELGWKECIDESKRITYGHKWELFVLGLSFIGWEFVGSLCFGVGTLWVTPYILASKAQFYESIKFSSNP